MRPGRRKKTGAGTLGSIAGGDTHVGKTRGLWMGAGGEPIPTGGVDTELKRKSVVGIPLPLPVTILMDATPDQAWRKSSGHTYGRALS